MSLTRFSQIAGRVVPDAITASIFLMVFLFAAALMIGNTVSTAVDAYYKGLWMLLPFTMQMVLIIVLSSILSCTPFFRRILISLSRRPENSTQVIVVSILLSSLLAYFNWGLGIALSPLIMIYFAREAEHKGIRIDFPFFLAAGYAATSVWQYGFSSSAPLLMATPGHFLQATTGVMPLSSTIWTPAAITMSIGFPVLLIAATCLLMPRNAQPLSQFPDAYKLAEPLGKTEAAVGEKGKSPELPGFSERLEQNSITTWILCLFLAAWLYYHFLVMRASLDLNSLNTIFLLLCFLLHKNMQNFTKALQASVLSAGPVLVIYHLYAGVAGLLQYTTMGEFLSNLVASVSTSHTFPFLAAVSGTAISIFVPSSGGQWVIQGYVTSTAAQSIGLTAQRGLLALGVGDQMGNLMAPFWYIVIAGVARIEFRRFLGFGLIFAPLWFLLGVLVFTFLRC